MELILAVAAAAIAAFVATMLARAAAGRRLAEQRAAFLDTAEHKLRDTFQALAADALRSNRAAFLDLAKTSFEGLHQQAALQFESRQQAMDGLVRPIADTLRKVDDTLTAVERDRLESYARLTERIAALGSTTDLLSRALRTPAVRGRWGEMQLRRVVEMAGMLRHCDFDEQPPLVSDNGRLRPDLIVHLPGGKQLVVDAKAPSTRSSTPRTPRMTTRGGSGCRRIRARCATTWRSLAARPTGTRCPRRPSSW
jgi:DNA recombination protein RmuC